MMLPHMRLRQAWLRRAVRDYPLYDPPHRVEERLLSREQAIENLDYFMGVRHRRLADFQAWLRRHFGVTLTPDRDGIKALNRWGNKYAGLLMYHDPAETRPGPYFTFDPRWTDDYAGYNGVFDMGIALGEIIIIHCPRLFWAVDPTWQILPRRSKVLKKSPGMSFQRPELTGCDNPAWSGSTLHDSFFFARQMEGLTTHPRACRYYRIHKGDRRRIRDQFLSGFDATLRDYPKGDPWKLLDEMSMDEYLEMGEAEATREDEHDD